MPVTRLLALALFAAHLTAPSTPAGFGSTEAVPGSAVTAREPRGGDILVTNFGGHTVTWYDGSTGDFGGVFVERGSGGLERPVGLAFGPDGDLYVASAGTDQVLRYDGRNGEFKGAFAEHERLRIPSLLRFGPDGSLYVGTFAGGTVLRFDSRTGALLGTAASGLVSPIGLRFDDAGLLYVASAGQNRVARFDSSGSFHDDLGAEAGLDFPTGIVFAPDGTLLVGSLRSEEVLRFDPETGTHLGAAGLLPKGAGPGDLAIDAKGRLLVADLTGGRLYRVEAVGEAAELIATEGLETPEGLAIVPASR